MRTNQRLFQVAFPDSIVPMDTEQPRCQVPETKFRVLIIGRANAGKTSILQRVCETTESPIIYRKTQWRTEEVRGPTLLSTSPSDHISNQVRLEPTMEVSENSASLDCL
jgi:GTPase SAR1 family protein